MSPSPQHRDYIYSLILRVTHLYPKDVLSHVSITSTPGLYLLFDIKSNAFISEGRTLPCLHHLNTGLYILFDIKSSTFTSEGCTLPCLHHLNTGIISTL